jgi:hypothetical protein
MKEALKELITEYKNDKPEKPHCIILYKTRGVGPSTTKYVDKVYQTIEDFETRGIERALEIPSEFGVYVEIYEFD